MRSASPDCSPAYYLICLVYPFTAAVVVFVRWCWRNSVRTRPLVVLSLAGMFVIQLGGVVYRIRRDPYHREYLPAADFLRARAQPGDLIYGQSRAAIYHRLPGRFRGRSPAGPGKPGSEPALSGSSLFGVGCVRATGAMPAELDPLARRRCRPTGGVAPTSSFMVLVFL